MTQKERTTFKKDIYKGKVFNIELHDIEFEDGNTSKREIVVHRGGVTILARDDQNRILFIKQYRKALETVMLELPAGKIEEGEDPEETALRELEEETGYTSERLIKLGEVAPSPGYLTEKIHIYKAEGLSEKKADLDWDEHIEMERYTDQEVKGMIRFGEIFDAKTIAALYLEGLM